MGYFLALITVVSFISGCTGPKGDVGENGSGIYLYGSDGARVGQFLTAAPSLTCALTTDSAIACFDVNGALSAPGADFSPVTNGCFYVANDCTGTCKVFKNSIFKNALVGGFPNGTTFIYRGTETSEGTVATASHYLAGGTTCTVAVTNVANAVSLTTYTPSVTFPLATPVSVY